MAVGFSTDQIPLIAAVLIIGYLMCKGPKSSYASLETPGPQEPTESVKKCEGDACDMQAGGGLSSSLLPKEVKPQEDYNELKVDRLLEGQAHHFSASEDMRPVVKIVNHFSFSKTLIYIF